MQVEISYEFSRQRFEDKFYGIKFTVVDEQKNYQFFPFKYRNLISDDCVWVKAENLLKEEYLKENNIEYIIDVNSKEIIPIGLLDFYDDKGEMTLNIYVDKTSKLYLVDQVTKNITDAIKLKYKTVELVEKFQSNKVDTIKL